MYTQHALEFFPKHLLSWIIGILNYRKNVLGTQNRVRIRQGERAIGCRIIEILLYTIVPFCVIKQRMVWSNFVVAQVDLIRASSTSHSWLGLIQGNCYIFLKLKRQWQVFKSWSFYRQYVLCSSPSENVPSCNSFTPEFSMWTLPALYFYIPNFANKEIINWMANVDTGETSRYEPSHLDIYCLQSYMF